MNVLPPLLLCVLGCGTASLALAELLPAVRVTDTIVSGERRYAIIETATGNQRVVAEGDLLGSCLVKHIRPTGIELDCHGRARSLGLAGRSRSV
jgi:hypothetical protein